MSSFSGFAKYSYKRLRSVAYENNNNISHKAAGKDAWARLSSNYLSKVHDLVFFSLATPATSSYKLIKSVLNMPLILQFFFVAVTARRDNKLFQPCNSNGWYLKALKAVFRCQIMEHLNRHMIAFPTRKWLKCSLIFIITIGLLCDSSACNA